MKTHQHGHCGAEEQYSPAVLLSIIRDTKDAKKKVVNVE